MVDLVTKRGCFVDAWVLYIPGFYETLAGTKTVVTKQKCFVDAKKHFIFLTVSPAILGAGDQTHNIFWHSRNTQSFVIFHLTKKMFSCEIIIIVHF